MVPYAYHLISPRWDVTKILIDNGSQDEILFLTAFEKWFLTENSSKNRRSPSMASVGKELNQSGSALPVSFITPKNPCIEYITFDVVDMLYLYSAIFG
jgi:hypothetical protein